MRKSKPYKKQHFDDKVFYRKNEEIRIPEVRLIDENGQMVGVVSTFEALSRAKNLGFDLIEVSPKAEPPVVKILDYGKFLYQQEKNARKQKAKQKKVELKCLRLSLRIGEHDKEIKINQARGFIADGNKVKLEIQLRGREKQYSRQAIDILNEAVKTMEDIVQIEQSATFQEGKIAAIVAPK